MKIVEQAVARQRQRGQKLVVDQAFHRGRLSAASAPRGRPWAPMARRYTPASFSASAGPVVSMKIGTIELPNALFVAPMAGVTDRPVPAGLCKRLGAGLRGQRAGDHR